MTAVSGPARRQPRQWFDLRGRRGLEMWAYVGMRVSGIALVVYLYLHLYVLRQLADGPDAWDAYVALAKTPLFLMLDLILLAGLLGHGLNGLRVALAGFGLAVSQHKNMLYAAVAIAVLLTAAGAYAMFFQGG